MSTAMWKLETDLCRCCHAEGSFKRLSDPCFQLGQEETYSDMLQDYFDIQIVPMVGVLSDITYTICETCVVRLRDACSFKRQVQDCEERFKDMYSKNLIKCAGTVSTDYEVKEEPMVLDSDNDNLLDLEEREELITVDIKVEPKGNGKAKPIELEAGELTEAAVSGEKEAEEPSVKSELVEGDQTSENLMLHEDLIIKSDLEEEDGTSGDDMLLYGAGMAGAALEPARRVSLRARQQLGMACSVRLERLRGDEAPHASQTCLATSRRGPGLASRVQDMPGDTAGRRAEGRAYTCDTCGEHFTHESRLIEHIQEHATSYNHEIRSKQVSNKSVLLKHKRIHTKAKLYSCEICNKDFTRKSSLKRHIATHTGRRPYGCDICHKQFTGKGYLKTHKRIHTGDKPYTCDICNKQFTVKSSLIIHIRTHTGQRPFTCKICSKSFLDSSDLTKHHRIHTGHKPYTCDICKKQFTLKQGLNIHVRIHTGQKPYSCKICSKPFANHSALNRHQGIHIGDKHTCDICKKEFAGKYSLIMHSRIHTGQRPFTCRICSKTFMKSSHLRRHEQIHTGDKRYTCDICKKQFIQKTSLITHTRMHTGERPYTCTICSKTFVDSSKLNRHQQVHTGKKPYICDICKEQFIRKTDFNVHLTIHRQTSQ